VNVFISYSSDDREFVERLARDLVRAGLSVWYDQWQLSVGDSLRDKISAGIEGSAYLAVVLSQASVQSKWVKEEVYAAMARAAEDGRVIVLPLLKEDCDIPALLKDKVYVDFRSDYEGAVGRLLERLRTAGPDQTGRTRRGEFLNDYSFDWGHDGKTHRFRLFVVSHSESAPASFLCRIEAFPNDAMDKRFSEYENAGLHLVPRLLCAGMMKVAIPPGTRVAINDEMPGYKTIEFQDPKVGIACTLEIEVRRMGEPLDKAVIYDVGDLTSEVFDLAAKHLDEELSEDDKKTWADFVKSTVIDKGLWP